MLSLRRLDRQDVQHVRSLLWASEVCAAVALAGAAVAVDFVALNFDKGGTELEPEVHLLCYRAVVGVRVIRDTIAVAWLDVLKVKRLDWRDAGAAELYLISTTSTTVWEKAMTPIGNTRLGSVFTCTGATIAKLLPLRPRSLHRSTARCVVGEVAHALVVSIQ